MDRNEIYRELFNRVVHGQYTGGEWLREDTFAAEIRVIRTRCERPCFSLPRTALRKALPIVELQSIRTKMQTVSQTDDPLAHAGIDTAAFVTIEARLTITRWIGI